MTVGIRGDRKLASRSDRKQTTDERRYEVTSDNDVYRNQPLKGSDRTDLAYDLTCWSHATDPHAIIVDVETTATVQYVRATEARNAQKRVRVSLNVVLLTLADHESPAHAAGCGRTRIVSAIANNTARP
jgi:hypothetical protein